jgi:NAD+ synthase (glutamine-hydrolysing)
MKVALAQINTTVGDLRGNGARILEFYRRAVEAGATLVVTPEMAITGYPPRDLLAKRRFVNDNLRTLEELAGQVGKTALLVGYVELHSHRPGKEYFNAAALIRDGKIVTKRFKTLLPTYDVFDEDRYFQPAESNEPVPLNGRRIGLTICEDIWTQDYLATRLYQRNPVEDLMRREGGAQIICNISASPYHLGKENIRFHMLQAEAKKYRVPLVYCNLVGGNDELVFDGNSMVFDAAGNLIAKGAAFREDLVVVDLDSPASSDQLPVTSDRSPITSRQSPITNLHDALVLGLRDYTHKCGFKSVVLGLSGGIDSAVTACLAVAALGPENVMGVSMPSQFSSKGSIDDARELAKNLAIRWEVIPIQDVFQVYRAAFKEVFKGLPEDTTEENIQARIRGTILMALSNKFGHMLLTTGNKSELAVGYCTLYGDMAGGLAVIADVPKTMIYELARYINHAPGVINRREKVIPQASLTKPPSAELRPNQTDQDTLPPYDMLDAILKKYVEESKSAAEIVAETKLDEKLVRDIVRKIDLNEYKRKQAPPCLRVTTKAFGIGRRVPIAQRYVER